jgi:hypothetical protein
MDLLAKEAAENRLPYPTKPYAVKTAEQLAAGPGAVAAPVGKTETHGATTPNATPAPPAK